MSNLLPILVSVLFLFFNSLISPVFLDTNTISNISSMDGWFKFTPVSAVHKGTLGRKKKPVSRLTTKMNHNTKKKGALLPIDQIDHCCKVHCFKQHTNMLQLQHLRNQYWDFTKDTARKQWFKELVLPGVPDDLDAELKQFTLLEVPVCYNYLRQLFGCSNNLLIGIKGTNWARGHISVEVSRQSRIGFR